MWSIRKSSLINTGIIIDINYWYYSFFLSTKPSRFAEIEIPLDKVVEIEFYLDVVHQDWIFIFLKK